LTSKEGRLFKKYKRKIARKTALFSFIILIDISADLCRMPTREQTGQKGANLFFS
jgi:hypothetical protein